MIPDHVEPLFLIIGKPATAVGLLRKPCRKVGIHAFGKGHQFVILLKGKADQGHQIR